MTQVQIMKKFAKDNNIKLNQQTLAVAKQLDNVRRIIKKSGIDVKKEFNPNKDN